MPELRTRSAGAKVTEKEHVEIEKLAASRGLNVGEWCRETLLARVNGQEPRAATACAGAGQVALMAELVALRPISAQRTIQAGPGRDPHGSGDARADRPGRLGQVEEGSGAALAGARARTGTERRILIVFSCSGVINSRGNVGTEPDVGSRGDLVVPFSFPLSPLTSQPGFIP
jgi:hypothetical protein